MTLITDFAAAVAAAENEPTLTGPHLSGSRLAWAAAHVLGAPSAGISISADTALRWPFGASDPDASVSEQLQFTAGEGPCLTAFAGQHPVMATGEILARSWPIFHRQLFEHTPFRSVWAAPLSVVGAVDFYFTDPDGCSRVDDILARGLADQVLTALLDDRSLSDLEQDALLGAPVMARRSRVSIAAGMLTVAVAVTHVDAMAILRAYAFTHDRTLDQVAGDLVDGTSSADEFRC